MKRVLLDSSAGRQRLRRCQLGDSFIRLLSAFEPQANSYFCGVACTTILLNAFQGKRTYSQETLNTDRIKSRRRMLNSSGDPGLTLSELAKLLKTYRLKTRIAFAEIDPQKGTSKLRSTVQSVRRSSSRYLIVNFNYASVGVPGGGHFAIVGVYDKKSDSVLMLDVAFHKTGWWWIGIPDLYRAMHTKDGRAWRGQLIVSRSRS